MNTAAAAAPGAGASASSSTGSLAEALALAESAASVREAAALLRQRYPALKVVVVDAFDMRHETPAAAGARRTLWGASSDGHCWQVCADLSAINGFYLADSADSVDKG
jgi:hypothetical protein